MDNESSHSLNNPDTTSLNTAIVAGSVQDPDVTCDACADEMKTWEAREDGLTPDAVEMGTAGELNEERTRLIEGCWVVDPQMDGVSIC